MILNDRKDKVEEGIIEEERKDIKLLRSQRVIPGLTLWEINDKEKTYRKAQFETEELVLDPDRKAESQQIKKKVILDDNCFYIQKLNEKSLLKFIKKYFGDGYKKELY